MNSRPMTLTRELARSLVRSLTRGTAIAEGAAYIHVGHRQWLQAQEELLAEVADDGHSDTKFVRGAYGAGKSHFLSMVGENARREGWVYSHLECKVDQVEIDRFETIYPRIVQKMSWIEQGRIVGGGRLDEDAVRLLLERWAFRVLEQAGFTRSGLRRPFDLDARAYRLLRQGLHRANLPPEFVRALTAFVRGLADDNHGTVDTVVSWCRGTQQRSQLLDRYVVPPDPGRREARSIELKAISRGTVREVMRGLLWLIHAAGFSGLVLCIDEIEELAKLTRKRQEQALQALREFVDDAGGDGSYKYLCMYLAATPEMFEGEQYFPRYDALMTRIQPIGSEINWRAPVIDLDKTPLSHSELEEMATRIHEIHRAAYGKSQVGLTDKFFRGVVAEIMKSRVRVAKPRLLARLVVDELERARQVGSGYNPPTSLVESVVQTADVVTREMQ